MAAKVVLVAGGAWLWLGAVQAGLVGRAGVEPEEAARARRVARALLAVSLPLGLLLGAAPAAGAAGDPHPGVLRRVRPDPRAVRRRWADAAAVAVAGPDRAMGQLPGAVAARALLIGCTLLGDRLARLSGRRELPAGGFARLLGIFAVTLACGFITPYGWRGLVLPIKLLLRLVPANANVFSNQVAENVPPLLLARGGPLQLLPLLLLLLLVAASFRVAPRDRIWGRGLIALAFTALALSANRNVLLLFWIAVPIAVANAAGPVCRGLADWRSRHAGRALRMLPVVGWGAAVAGLAALFLVALSHETPLDQPAPFRVPSGSARLIAESPGNGRIFAADHYGGYLIWRLHPIAAPYIDTRLVLRTADEYAEFLALPEQPQRWDAFARQHGFDHAALPTDFPDRYLPLIAHLYRAADWRLIYTDGTESLFRHGRASAPGWNLGDRSITTAVLADQDRRYGAQPEVAAAARLQLARLQLALGHPGEALHALATLTADDPAAQALAARCHLQMGDLTAAEAIARRLLEDAREPVVATNLLALVSLARGDLQAGIGWLRRSLSEDPFDPEARALLDQLEAQVAKPSPKTP